MDNGSGGKNLLPFLQFAVCDLRFAINYALCINPPFIVLKFSVILLVLIFFYLCGLYC